ncbi:MAG: DMT family transporter [Planktomarina sp.]
MTRNHPRLGILLMLGFCIVTPFSEVFVKIIGDALPLAQVVMARFAAQMILLRRETWATRTSWMTRRVLPWIILRAMSHLAASALFFWSLRYLPLADALAIIYVLPFLILFIGWMTGETIRPIQIALAIIGFAGALCVVQPSFAEVGWPAAVPLLVAVLFTAFMFLTRKVSPHISPIDLQGVNGVMSVLMILPFILIGNTQGWPEAHIVEVDHMMGLYLIAIGLIGTLGHLLMTYSLQLTTPSVVAPVQYLEIPMAALLGFWVFQDVPNGLAAIGIVVVIITGILVLFAAPPEDPPADDTEPPSSAHDRPHL